MPSFIDDPEEIQGLTRADFHRRFIRAARTVLERGRIPEDNELDMATKLIVQDLLARLTVCPCCGGPLEVFPDYPLEKSCSCGDFTITAVWTSGDVEFTFKMNGPEAVTEEIEPNPRE